MIASPEEIRELLSTVREILREHRRMALYAKAYTSAVEYPVVDAEQALKHFDAQFPMEGS
jgi:hypothetical protein